MHLDFPYDVREKHKKLLERIERAKRLIKIEADACDVDYGNVDYGLGLEKALEILDACLNEPEPPPPRKAYPNWREHLKTYDFDELRRENEEDSCTNSST